MAKSEFGQRALGILNSVKNQSIMNSNELKRLMSAFVASTGFDGTAAQLADIPQFFEKYMYQEYSSFGIISLLSFFHNNPRKNLFEAS